MPKKGQKFVFKNFVLNKYQSVTHVSTYIFQGLFKNIVSRSVALDTKNSWAFWIFFTDRTFFRPLPFPINQKKYFLTKIL